MTPNNLAIPPRLEREKGFGSLMLKIDVSRLERSLVANNAESKR